jgi:murein DD-endopeptidase MepM/ murein hydrolase activator NlpD
MTVRFVAFLTALLLLPSVGESRTPPRRGAASKPRSFLIQPPFPCGTPIRVNCGYGARAHRRVSAVSSTSDYYAVDLVRADDANNGFNMPVVAVAAGVVRVAGWAQHGWAPYGKVVYVEHDFRDRSGERFYSLYAHLNRVTVREGQRVEAGSTIGTLGGSSKRRLHAFGAHLHFAMYKGARPNLGGGRSVVPEPMGAAGEDLQRGTQMVACAAPAPLPVASSSLPEGVVAAVLP